MLRNLGSTLAIILGLIMIATIGTQPQSSTPIAGVVTLLGALAYRSCKRRRLCEVRSRQLRKGLEILALVAAVLIIVLQTNLKERLYFEPVSNILPIIWVLVAYAFATLRRYPAPQVES
jgi:TRAP-type C4-dicarboxylate transport system permease large subunit